MPPETLPNYDEHADSPAIDDMGVAVKLIGGPFRVGTPIVLRGAYKIDQAQARLFDGEPLICTMVITVRRDKAMGRIRMVQDGHNMAPQPPAPPGPINPTVRAGGFFNLDLVAFAGLINEPGRFWVMASLGDLVSERVEFEVRP